MKTLALIFLLALILPLPAASVTLNFQQQWSFHHTIANGSHAQGSEIVAFDSLHRRLWVVGSDANEANLGFNGIDILDLSGNLVHSIDTRQFGSVNSVAISKHQAAVALTAPLKTDPGTVRFYDLADYEPITSIGVGANPDMVKFTENGRFLLVANEGEPSSYLIGPAGDPEGSVSIIDTRNYQVKTADFSAFNNQNMILKAQGVRLSGPNATVAQDLEPEYIAIDHSDKQAMVTLQEANAVAIIDIPNAQVKAIKALGKKNHNSTGNGLDVSDRDGPRNDPLNGNIQKWLVNGLYMPDGIAGYHFRGKQYYFTANEGDSRADWSGGNDEIRVGSATIDANLFANLSALYGNDWQSNNDKLNRLTVTTTGDLDGDGDLDEIQAFGARSFSILDEEGNRLFDSGDTIEQIIKADYPELWDDSRSDNKGPEPESVVIGKVQGRDLLFVGLERTLPASANAIMVWDITDLNRIEFLTLIKTPGDVGPEGLAFFKARDKSYLAIANEVSETTTLYQISIENDKKHKH